MVQGARAGRRPFGRQRQCSSSGSQSAPLPTAQARPVRTVIIERRAEGETVSLTGQVRAKDQVSLALRLDGKMIERPVNVGDVLTAGQVVARLDPLNQQNELRSAKAVLLSVLSLTVLMFQLQGFNRLFLVLSVAPLGLIGVVAARLVSDKPLGFVALLGLLAFTGTIARNSVILIAQVEKEKAEGRRP